MPKFAANLTMLFTEVGFLDRFGAAGVVMRSAHLVRPRMMASWSGSSCSSPTLRPIIDCWIWPVRASTGAFTA